VGNPIDAFILTALEKRQLTLSPDADRPALLRRVSFDLIGLSPTPKDIDDFLNDKSPSAYEKVVERLLASPHYGERWARHWLDLAGYADSEGILNADYVRSAAWRYRDYVIRSFNQDKPYDRFLQEQIAGDELVDYWNVYQTYKELPADVVEALIATGYLRCASDTSRPDFVNIKNAPGYYFQTLDDTLKIVASSTLGLTSSAPSAIRTSTTRSRRPNIIACKRFSCRAIAPASGFRRRNANCPNRPPTKKEKPSSTARRSMRQLLRSRSSRPNCRRRSRSSCSSEAWPSSPWRSARMSRMR
jgi:hypothetical protein